LIFRDSQRAARPVVPVVAGQIVVDISQATVIRVTAVEAVLATLKNLPVFISTTKD